MAKITVVVPVYKVEAYLRRCVDSILRQSFRDFEVVLVDDESPDDCGAICDSYARADARVHVIHKKNGGLGQARISGVEWTKANIRSEWIYFIDSDDWMHENLLESMYRAVETSGADVAVCDMLITSEVNVPDGKLEDVTRCMQILTPSEFWMKGSQLLDNVAWGKLWRSEWLLPETLSKSRAHEDMFATYKLLFKANKIALIPLPMMYYYQRADSICNCGWSPTRMLEFDAFQKQISFFERNGFRGPLRTTVVFCLTRLNDNVKLLSRLGEFETECQTLKTFARELLATWSVPLNLTFKETWRVRRFVSWPRFCYWPMSIVGVISEGSFLTILQKLIKRTGLR